MLMRNVHECYNEKMLADHADTDANLCIKIISLCRLREASVVCVRILFCFHSFQWECSMALAVYYLPPHLHQMSFYTAISICYLILKIHQIIYDDMYNTYLSFS